MKVYQKVPDLLRMLGKNEFKFLDINTLSMNIVKMGCSYGARDYLLSPTIKWSGSMLYTIRLTADKRIPQKWEAKGTLARYN